MLTERAREMARSLSERGGPFHYGAELSRLVVQVVRDLARGAPLSKETIAQTTEKLGISADNANIFLRRKAERDKQDYIVGIMGLSLKNHPHIFSARGIEMSSWCALDACFLPSVLRQTAFIESVSPLSTEMVRPIVGPKGVVDVVPSDAVVSLPIVQLDSTDMSSTSSEWKNFCRHVLFFSSRAEAETWGENRNDIEILSVEEAFEFGQLLCSEVLPYA